VRLLFKLFLVRAFGSDNETNVIELPILRNEHLALNLRPLSQAGSDCCHVLVDIFSRIKASLARHGLSKWNALLLNLYCLLDIEIIIGIILAHIVVCEISIWSRWLLIGLESRIDKSLLAESTLLRLRAKTTAILKRILLLVVTTRETTSRGSTAHIVRS